MKPDSFHMTVMRKLAQGPQWIRSLGPYKAWADDLCARGFAERVYPKGGSARNMMALTDAGRTLFESRNAA